MGEYREIFAKAIVAKGRKFTQSSHTICPPNEPACILGCWIINHTYEAQKVGRTVEIEGYYDINTWYAYCNNTKTEVVTERVDYKDIVKLKYRDPDCLDDQDVIARVLQQPNCVEAVISPSGNRITVHVEREFLVEVIGETKICVAVYPEKCEDQDGNWGTEISDDDFEDLDPDFLEESKDR